MSDNLPAGEPDGLDDQGPNETSVPMRWVRDFEVLVAEAGPPEVGSFRFRALDETHLHRCDDGCFELHWNGITQIYSPAWAYISLGDEYQVATHVRPSFTPLGREKKTPAASRPGFPTDHAHEWWTPFWAGWNGSVNEILRLLGDEYPHHGPLMASLDELCTRLAAVARDNPNGRHDPYGGICAGDEDLIASIRMAFEEMIHPSPSTPSRPHVSGEIVENDDPSRYPCVCGHQLDKHGIVFDDLKKTYRRDVCYVIDCECRSFDPAPT